MGTGDTSKFPLREIPSGMINIPSDQFERFGRAVWFTNRTPVRSDADVLEICQEFARDPMSIRVLYERDENLSSPIPRRRTVFFGAGNHPESGSSSAYFPSSRSILPGDTLYTGTDALFAVARSLSGETTERRLPMGAPDDYVEHLETLRGRLHFVLADLIAWTARGDALADQRVDVWTGDTYLRCAESYAVADLTSPTGSRLWLNGVEAACTFAVMTFRDWPEAVRKRLSKCGKPACQNYVFTPPCPGTRRPRRHCEGHSDAAYNARRHRQ